MKKDVGKEISASDASFGSTARSAPAFPPAPGHLYLHLWRGIRYCVCGTGCAVPFGSFPPRWRKLQYCRSHIFSGAFLDYFNQVLDKEGDLGILAAFCCCWCWCMSTVTWTWTSTLYHCNLLDYHCAVQSCYFRRVYFEED
jgi:hypothetical protein